MDRTDAEGERDFDVDVVPSSTTLVGVAGESSRDPRATARTWASVTRRAFMNRTGRISLAAAALVGGIVGYAPTEEAYAAVACIPGTKESIPDAACVFGCTGLCNPGITGCDYGGEDEFECFCLPEAGACTPKDVKPAVVCLITGSYGCCVAC